MAAFAAKSYSHQSYAAFRPEYPKSLYDTILEYQRKSGPQNLLVDLGCGHGVVARSLAPHFTHVLAIDPSEGMLATARTFTPHSEFPNIEFHAGTAESLHFIPNASIDLLVAAQAAHWFDYSRAWLEFSKKVAPGGSLAFWGLRNTVFVDYPEATRILQDYTTNPDPRKLGSYWPAPGSKIMASMYADIVPPEEEWEDVQRVNYRPGTKGENSGEGICFVRGKITVRDCKELMRTWSAFHHWSEAHPEKKKRRDGGEGDVVDWCFDEIVAHDGRWGDEGWEVEVEYESFLLMARRKGGSS